jgi:IMP dehydrogenase
MVHFDDNFINALDYSDVFILPRYSSIETRTDVDLGSMLGDLKLGLPIISSNMDSITESEMSRAMYKAGGIGALHRFMSIEKNVDEFKSTVYSFASIGVNRDSKERATALYEAGARHFILDIAHGHSIKAREMTLWLKSEFKDIHLMVGNVSTSQAVLDLEKWGADSIKVGIGPGSVCLTKDVTGVTVPQLSAVINCVGVASVPIIADGGIKSIGDIAKALAAGADYVMLGGMLSGTNECPGEVIENKKVYRGMASRDAMKVIRTEGQMPTPEGKVTMVDCKGPVANILEDIAGGLRSSFSYVNARTIEEFKLRASFGTRRTVR